MLIAVGVLAAFFGSCAAFFVHQSNTPEAAAARASASVALQNALDADRVAAADKEAKVRKLCKIPPKASVYVAAPKKVRSDCRDIIRASLKVPSSADFAYDGDEPTLLSDDGGCRLIYQSSVEAQNAFGVKIQTPFKCVYDQRTGDITGHLVE